MLSVVVWCVCLCICLCVCVCPSAVCLCVPGSLMPQYKHTQMSTSLAPASTHVGHGLLFRCCLMGRSLLATYFSFELPSGSHARTRKHRHARAHIDTHRDTHTHTHTHHLSLPVSLSFMPTLTLPPLSLRSPSLLAVVWLILLPWSGSFSRHSPIILPSADT